MTEEGGQLLAAGIGSLLMVDADLPRDEFGWPYPPLFYFQGERITGLVYDDEGHVLSSSQLLPRSGGKNGGGLIGGG